MEVTRIPPGRPFAYHGLRTPGLKYCWPKVIYCICQPNELEREIKKKTGGQPKIWGAVAHQSPSCNHHWHSAPWASEGYFSRGVNSGIF